MNLIPAFFHRRIAHRPNLVNIADNICGLVFRHGMTRWTAWYKAYTQT